jgi:hypothetical protein
MPASGLPALLIIDDNNPAILYNGSWPDPPGVVDEYMRSTHAPADNTSTAQLLFNGKAS